MTLDTIPKNWYVELELRHGTKDWAEMIRHFVATFNFEDDSSPIDTALQIIRGKVFIEPTTYEEELEHALACYNLAMDGGDGESDEEDLRHLDIEETKGEREAQGP